MRIWYSPLRYPIEYAGSLAVPHPLMGSAKSSKNGGGTSGAMNKNVRATKGRKLRGLTDTGRVAVAVGVELGSSVGVWVAVAAGVGVALGV